jgi:glycosyltransferase involved in cell wall biosynthesis
MVRVVSDIDGLERVAGPGTTVEVFSQRSDPKRWPRNFALLRAALRSDYLIINFSLYEVIFFALFLAVIPGQGCRLVTLDFFLDPPAWQVPVVRWTLGCVYKMLVYFRDTARFEALYRLPASRFQYVPFKINSWEMVRQAASCDGSYIFVGGRSRRDFATLFEAVKDLSYPVRILTAPERDLTPHGTSLAGLSVPPNVEIIYRDTDEKLWIDLMANARLVVLPIVKDSPVQAGIGVYLKAMALGKCVIISEALGVSDVLDSSHACIVPGGEAGALRTAIETLWNDDERRAAYAQAACAYATPLGGEDQLRTSVLKAIGATTRSAGRRIT